MNAHSSPSESPWESRLESLSESPLESRSASPSEAVVPSGSTRWSYAALLLLPFVAGCSVLSRFDFGHPFSRQGWQRSDRVIESLGLEPGARVADLGSGDGYFSFWLADAVGASGRVYAVDIDAAALGKLAAKATRRGYANIETVRGAVDDARLPEAVDLVFVCNAYHHFEDRVPYFRGLREALAPGARLAIVDGRSEGPATWFLPKGHWLEPGQLEDELSQAGYAHVESHDFLPLQSFDVFRVATDTAR